MTVLLRIFALSVLLLSPVTGTTARGEDKPSLIVGAIYVGSVNDYGYNRAMKDGLEEMKQNIPGLKLIEAENVPETGDAERIMEGMIQQGAKLIFATSFGHQQSAFNLAKTHPDVAFEHAGGWMQAPNFGNFFGATQTAWYAMGVAAGKMTKTNTLGFVIGVPIGYAIGNVNAFQLGALSVNLKAQTRVVVTGGWADKAKEAAAANALIDQGADVITMHVDSPSTIIQIAEGRGAMSIGFQSIEARRLAPKGWITGLGFSWGSFMTDTAKNVMAGTFKGGMVRQGLGNMLVVAPFGVSVPDDVKQIANAAADKIKGGYNPFTGPIKDNSGEIRIAAGETWGNDKMGKFDWYAEGVIGKAK
jgi:simple sugar transport system substrate-binding protein/basic membrane protein A